MISSPTSILSHTKSDSGILWALRLLSIVTGSLLLLVFGFLLEEAIPIIKQIGVSRFFTDSGWFPTEASFELLPMIWGTLSVTLGAMFLAGPLGVTSAVFCHFYAPPSVGKVYRFMIGLLAGIPSVVFGFWGLVVLVPMIGAWHPPGPSLLAGTIILSLMIIPTIMLVTYSSISQLPIEYMQSATALGFRKCSLIWRILLPSIRSGIITAVLLGMARALGETMAILMVCGNVVQIPSHVFDPIRTLTANIALEMAYALGTHRSALFVSGLFLLGLVILLVSVAERLRIRRYDAPLP